MRFTVQRILGIAPAIALGLAVMPGSGFAQTDRPDLVVFSLAPPPLDALPGDSFLVSSTVKNQGPGSADPTVTKFYLVPATGPVKNLKGVQTIDGLAPGASAAPPVTVAIYSDTLPGDYTLLACANKGDLQVLETTKTNNCLPATGTITVHDVPDLVVTFATSPPASLAQGQAFPSLASYKVKNTGPVPAGASTARFFLVSTADGSRIDLKGLAADQAVPALNPQQEHFATNVQLTVRPETVPGSYAMVACADTKKVVTESDENDNCFLAGLVQVTAQADLVVNKVMVTTDPPTVQQGGPVAISAVVRNAGLKDAGASTMKFVLIPPSGTPTKNLKGTEPVPAVPQGTKVTVQAALEVYSDTPPGIYTVQACVDSKKVVDETSNGNNCTSSGTQLTVTGIPLSPADLAVVSLTEPPPLALPGDPVQLTASVQNVGTGASAPTSTTFNLVNAAGARVKNLKGVQSVPAVAKGATVNPTPAAIAFYTDTPPGTYFLQACADGNKEFIEVNEDNNCMTSKGTVTIQSVPDLTMTAIGNPPAAIVAGQPLPSPTSYSVTNTGPVGAAASTAKFYLVPTAVGATRINLKGEDGIPALSANQVFNHSLSLKVAATTAPGTYALQGCADSGKVVLESDEEDNCKLSAQTVQVTGLPNLIVNAVRLAAPSVTVARGGTVPITVVVRNEGFVNAPASTVKLSLVVTPGAAPTKTIPESPAVPAVVKDTKQTVQATVTIPSSTPVGTYVVQGCVDAAKLVAETSDEDNCATSGATIKVQ